MKVTNSDCSALGLGVMEKQNRKGLTGSPWCGPFVVSECSGLLFKDG